MKGSNINIYIWAKKIKWKQKVHEEWIKFLGKDLLHHFYLIILVIIFFIIV